MIYHSFSSSVSRTNDAIKRLCFSPGKQGSLPEALREMLRHPSALRGKDLCAGGWGRWLVAFYSQGFQQSDPFLSGWHNYYGALVIIILAIVIALRVTTE
jgi:hypothetical protein